MKAKEVEEALERARMAMAVASLSINRVGVACKDAHKAFLSFSDVLASLRPPQR